MSILDYKNIDEIKTTILSTIEAETISASDVKLLQITKDFKNIDDVNYDIVEMHVYANDDSLTLLFSIKNLKEYVESRGYVMYNFFSTNRGGQVSFDVTKFFAIFQPFFSGKVKISFNFIKAIVASDTFNELITFDISPSRNEARIKYTLNDGKIDFSRIPELSINSVLVSGKQSATDLSIGQNIFINLGNDNLFSVINVLVESPDSLIARFYDPLPTTVDVKQFCYICSKKINSNILTTEIFGEVSSEIDNTIKLKPNFTVKVPQSKLSNDNLYKNLDTLTGVTNTAEILSNFSSSMDSLNVEYFDYNNFVYYSSAVKRLENFKDKLTKIQNYASDIVQYSSSIGILISSGSTTFAVSQSLMKTTQLLNDTISTFTPYEKYLYYESSSYASSSLGETFDASWPKTTSIKPYSLYTVASQKAMDWYDGQYASASLYDKQNISLLTNTIPTFIQEDDQNDDYMLFINMVAEYFDELHLYIKHVTSKDIHGLTENTGISNNLIVKFIEQFGSELITDIDTDDLGTFLLNNAGNDTSIRTLPTSVKKNVLLKRFFSNIVFFLKSKGSYQLLHAFANMLGIDRDYYEIREYGGPDVTAAQLDPTVVPETSVDYTNLVYSLRFDGAQNVNLLWKDYNSKKPDSIIFKFKLNNGLPVTQSLFAASGFAVRAIKTGWKPTTGKLQFTINGNTVSTEEIPVFNGAFWNVMFQRSVSTNNPATTQTYTLKTNTIHSDTINFYVSASLTTSAASINGKYMTSSAFSVGSGSLVGNVTDLKFFTEVLRDDIFKRHSLSQIFLIGNAPGDSAENLVTHIRFDENKNLALTSSIYDANVSSFGKNHGTASGFTNNTFEQRYEKNIVKLNTTAFSGRPTSNKIRIVNNYVTHSDGNVYLSMGESIEPSSLTKYGKDLNKVDFIFSPANIENKQIIMFLNPEITDYIADPKFMIDEQGSYTELDTIYKYYRKYNPAIPLQDYIDNAYQLSKTLFRNIHQFNSERTILNAGISLEPNILERTNVVMIKSVDIQNVSYEASLLDMVPTLLPEYIYFTSSINALSEGITSEYNYLASIISAIPFDPIGSYVDYNVSIGMADDVIFANNYFLGEGVVDHHFLDNGLHKRFVQQATSSNNDINTVAFYTTYTTHAPLYEPAMMSFIKPISDVGVTEEFTGSIGWYTKRNSAAEPLYTSNYALYYAPNHIKYYIYNGAGQLAYFNGTQTRGPENPNGATTLNGDQVIEVTFISPNTATVVTQDTNRPRLKVDGVDLNL